MEQAVKILEFLKFTEKLKCQERDLLVSNGKRESVAEHSYQAALMAMLVYPYLKVKTDLLKTLKMLLIHDVVEAEIGDLPYVNGHKDKELKKQKQIKEKEEIEKIRLLIGEESGQEIYDLWYEFEERQTPEAKFAKAVDCLEADTQGNLYGSVDYWDPVYFKLIYTKSRPHCQDEPIFQEIFNLNIKESEALMKKHGVDLDKIKAKIISLSP